MAKTGKSARGVPHGRDHPAVVEGGHGLQVALGVRRQHLVLARAPEGVPDRPDGGDRHLAVLDERLPAGRLGLGVGRRGAHDQRAHPRLGIGVLLDQVVEHVVAGDVAELGAAHQHPPLEVDVVRGGLTQLVEVGQRAGARPGAQGGLRVAALLDEPGRRLGHQLAERLALALRRPVLGHAGDEREVGLDARGGGLGAEHPDQALDDLGGPCLAGDQQVAHRRDGHATRGGRGQLCGELEQGGTRTGLGVAPDEGEVVVVLEVQVRPLGELDRGRSRRRPRRSRRRCASTPAAYGGRRRHPRRAAAGRSCRARGWRRARTRSPIAPGSARRRRPPPARRRASGRGRAHWRSRVRPSGPGASCCPTRAGRSTPPFPG